MKVIHHNNLGETEDGKKLYASLPMGLARDTGLTANAARVALFVWSHNQGFNQSAALVAKALGMHRDTVAVALANLHERGWLVREQIWRPGKLKPSSEIWHLQMSNTPFTDDEKRKLRGDTLPKNPAPSDVNLPKNPAPGCLGIRQEGAQSVGTLVVNTSSARSADCLSSTKERAENTGTLEQPVVGATTSQPEESDIEVVEFQDGLPIKNDQPYGYFDTGTSPPELDSGKECSAAGWASGPLWNAETGTPAESSAPGVSPASPVKVAENPAVESGMAIRESGPPVEDPPDWAGEYEEEL